MNLTKSHGRSELKFEIGRPESNIKIDQPRLKSKQTYSDWKSRRVGLNQRSNYIFKKIFFSCLKKNIWANLDSQGFCEHFGSVDFFNGEFFDSLGFFNVGLFRLSPMERDKLTVLILTVINYKNNIILEIVPNTPEVVDMLFIFSLCCALCRQMLLVIQFLKKHVCINLFLLLNTLVKLEAGITLFTEV